MAASVNVGDINRAVGANQAVVSLRDEHTPFTANDAAALGDGQFDDTRIETIPARPATGSEGRSDCLQVDELAFGLGNDFMFDDQDIARAEALISMF